jgi:hypothetical protein
MSENIEKVLQNEEKIELIVKKTSKLQSITDEIRMNVLLLRYIGKQSQEGLFLEAQQVQSSNRNHYCGNNPESLIHHLMRLILRLFYYQFLFLISSSVAPMPY